MLSNATDNHAESVREMPLSTVVDSDEDGTNQEGEGNALSPSFTRVKPVNREPDSYEKRGFMYHPSIGKSFQRERWDRLYGNGRNPHA